MQEYDVVVVGGGPVGGFVAKKIATKGFKVAKKFDQTGILGANVARLEFEDLRVPAENLLGKEGKGFPILMSELNIERVVMSASCVGNAQAAFNDALKYSNERVQFGTSISRQQAVSFRIADSAAHRAANQGTGQASGE